MSSERQPVEMSQDQLLAEALELTEHRAQPYLSEARKAQLSNRINLLLFELNCQKEEAGGVS